MSHTTEERATTASDLTTETSLCSAFQRTAARVPERVALRSRGDAVSITWGGYAERVEAIARGLDALGVKSGDAVAIMLVNRPEFHLVDTAVLHLGGLTVSIYNTLPPADIAYILRDSGARIVVCEDSFLEAVQAARSDAPVDQLVVVDGEPANGVTTLEELEQSAADGFDFEARWRKVSQEDLAVLIYTSGTTGPPKGVELTHGAILGNLQGMHEAIGTVDGARVVSLLPMAHIAERQFSHYRAMAYGFTTTSCPDPRQLVEHLLEVRPHYFFCPPRPFEKFRSALEAQIATDPELSIPAERLLELGRRKLQLEADGTAVPAELVQELDGLQSTVGKQLRAVFGLESIEVALTGSAPVQPDLMAFWAAVGLPVLEAWGLSECGAFGAFTRPGQLALGTVGKPPPGVEIRLLDDGEILLRSPWIMRGYRNLPERTAETIDPDGWLHTGDVGAWDDRGNLRIIDRKKELIINASGKNMSPVSIEGKLKDASPLIGQACAVGDRRPYNVALLVLDPEAASAFARTIGAGTALVPQLVQLPELQAAIEEAVQNANERMSRVEQIKRYKLLTDEWLPGGDELTPTMKLKRRHIAEKYAADIDEIYAR